MKLPKQIKVIVAGNISEYFQYLKENDLTPNSLFTRYAVTKKSLEGLTNCEVVYYGSYWNNKLFGQSILDDITKS